MLIGNSLLKFNVLNGSWKPANTKIRIWPDPTSDPAGSGSGSGAPLVLTCYYVHNLLFQIYCYWFEAFLSTAEGRVSNCGIWLGEAQNLKLIFEQACIHRQQLCPSVTTW